MAVINFGSINIDHIYSVPHFVTPGETLSSTQYQSVLGGKGANQSIACALSGCDTKHVGGVHINDSAFVAILQQAGVDCQYINQQSAIATGHAIIQVNDEAENAIVLFAGANHALSSKQIDTVLQNATSDDWVLLQNETNAIAEIIDKAAALGLPIAFNPAPMTPEVAALPLEKLSLLMVNEIEAMQLTQTSTLNEATAVFQSQYPNTEVIMTLGKAGVQYLYQGEQIVVKGFDVKAVDTTAAGDTFTGYFLAEYIKLNDNKRADIEHALLTACAAAAICVTGKGAAPSIPDMATVQQFLTAN